MITPHGIAPDPAKIQGITSMRLPESWSDLGRFVGMTVWHNDCVPNLSALVAPLRIWQNKKKQGVKFILTDEMESSWRACQDAISNAVLKEHDGPGTIEIYVDWSKPAISGHILRVHKNKIHLMEYASRALTAAESLYPPPLGEMLAIWWLVVKKWRHYVRGRSAKVYSDHKTLKGLHLRMFEGVWATMLLDLLETGIEVATIPGKKNAVADAMGRLMSLSKPVDSGLPLLPSPFNPVDDSQVLRVDKIEDRRSAFIETHTGPVGGHFSLPKTLKFMKARYTWPGMEADIRDWLSACDWEIW